MKQKPTVTAIILCGGMGTRLRSITQDQTCKPMVDVAGKPFLEYLLDYCISQNIAHAILAVGHHRNTIMEYFGHQHKNLTISYSIEEHPLGTGGALKQALSQPYAQQSDLILALNGDSFISFSLTEMIEQLNNQNAELIMVLRSLDNTGRYGRVTVDEHNKLIAFEEKKGGHPGNINSGVYLMRPNLSDQFPRQNTFSFETDFLEAEIGHAPFYGVYTNNYFIDIGTPEDYQIAQRDFAQQQHIS
ncbi:nucleotidyltransferase family protein [Vibrio nitrifigilis]|uniref:Nucleotidyltransferase family protein n=1 Tax=Vibrio nitrifigilis TaxID=2789781 RepID=A0ABS0GI77_9VIBR|nr:nucleotidyltransferase family protein [Vibrio nitrifigilis]MBF9002146.1 nucleotidyltransferase family protein [Vibrio nitrifigilis]